MAERRHGAAPGQAEQDPARLLRSDRDGLDVLAADASVWFRDRGLAIPQLTVVKDYWVTEVLRSLSQPLIAARQNARDPRVHARAVFKGGTSLSKAHGLLHRFSEDVDVYIDAYEVDEAGNILSEGVAVGTNRTNTLMKMAAERVAGALDLTFTEFEYQRAGSKRGYIFDYGAGLRADQALKDGVQVELVRMGHPTPSASQQVSSMLAEFAAATGRFALDDFDDAAPVTIDVLSPERTLVDKLCILHDQAVKVLAGEGYELRRHARHYYDVHQLLDARSIRMNLRANPGMVAAYAAEAAEDSVRNRRPGQPRPEEGFGASPAFCDEAVLGHAREAYTQEMADLGYGPMPEFDRVLEVVEASRALL